MNNNKNRRSIRLKGYDYSFPGCYFVTICIQDRTCLLGQISDSNMILNDAGIMIYKWCLEIPHKFPDITLDTLIVMPNHFHAIFTNTGPHDDPVGADLCVCPKTHVEPVQTGEPVGADQCVCPFTDLRVCPEDGYDLKGEHTGSPLRVCPNTDNGHIEQVGHIQMGEHTGSPLHRVVQWFKTMTTNDYIRGVKQHKWQEFRHRLWQRNYYEHIIRNEEDYNNTKAYILSNPINWENDQLYQ